jgi:DNA modification methylase
MPPVTPDIKELSKLTKDEWREWTKTVWHIANTTDPDHPAVFPEEIPKRLIKMFTFCGETVLDPFAGTGTTAIAALKSDRKAICLDQNPEYIRVMNERITQFNGKQKLASIREYDSRRLAFLKDKSVSLVVTSPPYWNKADYGENPTNLGNVGNYKKFFEEIRPVMEECFRVLEDGRKLCVVTANVNQQTNHGLLTFPLSTDFANLLRDIGFVMINEIIWSKDGTGGRWGSHGKQRPIFGSYPYPPNFLFKNVHEYILIFAKPSVRATKGPKVIQYEQLMEITTQ